MAQVFSIPLVITTVYCLGEYHHSLLLKFFQSGQLISPDVMNPLIINFKEKKEYKKITKILNSNFIKKLTYIT